jgi:hypothetical protein
VDAFVLVGWVDESWIRDGQKLSEKAGATLYLTTVLYFPAAPCLTSASAFSFFAGADLRWHGV